MHPFCLRFFCLFYARENKWTLSTQSKTLWDKELQQAKILATILKLCSQDQGDSLYSYLQFPHFSFDNLIYRCRAQDAHVFAIKLNIIKTLFLLNFWKKYSKNHEIQNINI